MEKIKKKSIYFFACAVAVVCLAFACLLAPVAMTNAKAAGYFAFSSVSAVYADDSVVAVADENYVHLFEPSGEKRLSLNLGGVTAIEKNGDDLYALSDEKIYLLSDESEYFNTVAVKDFAFGSGLLLVVTGSEVKTYDSSLSEVSSVDFGSEVLSVAADGTGAYAVASSGSRADVYKLNGTLVADQIKYEGALSVADGKLYAVAKGGKLVRITEAGAEDEESKGYVVCTGGSTLCYATDEGQVFVGGELFLARSSDENGFYHSPKGVAARTGKTVVCDHLNNRLVIMRGEQTEYVSIARPVAVSINNAGETFVAYGGNKVAKLSSSGEKTDVTLPSSIGVIDDIYCDNSGRLFVLSNGALTVANTGAKAYEGVSAICGERAVGKIYAVRGNSVLDGGSTVFSAESDIDALCADEGGSFFYVAGGTLYRYFGGVSTAVASGLSSKVRLTVSRVSDAKFGYGDIIVSDESACRVYAVSAEQAGSIMGTASAPAVQPYETENIIRSTRIACALFATPNETDVRLNVAAGTKLVVINEDVTGFSNFALVGYEDAVTKKLIRCYVFKSNLSEPLPYVAPPASEGTVYADGTKLYALPSTDAERLCEALPVGTRVTLLPFAVYSDGVKWYRAEYEGNTGYLVSTAISVRNFIPDSERPQCNAVIAEYNGQYAAPLYELTDGVMAKIEGEMLTAGTKVEVVGAFDTSKKYTLIKYFDEDLGTLTCYVETVFIDYNSVSVVQIVALAIAVVTVVLLAVVICKIVRKKNRI